MEHKRFLAQHKICNVRHRDLTHLNSCLCLLNVCVFVFRNRKLTKSNFDLPRCQGGIECCNQCYVQGKDLTVAMPYHI